MAAETYMSTSGPNQTPYGFASSQPLSPMSQPPNPFESAMAMPNFPERHGSRSDPTKVSAILMRRLPRNTSNEALRSMLLFAKDFMGADFITTENADDNGYLTAIARFRTPKAAQEACAMLDGKSSTVNEAKMIVEVLHLSPGGNFGGSFGPRRHTLDVTLNRGATSSSSSTGSSSGQNTRQSSRYNGAFQALDGISPAAGTPNFNNGGQAGGELPPLDTGTTFHNYYSPTSPIGHPLERQRISGKSIIGEDGVDDETGELLKDPLTYARNDGMGQSSRRATNPQLPTSQFAGMSLSNNGLASPPLHGYSNQRSGPPLQSPTTAMSPSNMTNMGPNASYQLANQHYARPNYPPVNPADQNPPCNTLYVGNLPIDTSEDELKAMFSKQRGYKRLCFRTKQNGPMCFVEFEDVGFATKALSELYGHPLHNSVKGGIRLSFSKNPLGVRTGQPVGNGIPTPMSPQGPISGSIGYGGLQSFSTVNGPPPGLAPPGLSPSSGLNGGTINSMGSPGIGSPYGGVVSPMSGNSMLSMKSPPLNGNVVNAPPGVWNGYGGAYQDYMIGR